MMREIKCRGKVKYNGQHFFSGDFVEGYYAYKELDGKHIILVERPETMRHASYFVEIEVDAETVGQYTGLKDKNGNEIFEGDLMKWTSTDTDGSLMTQIDEVKWSKYGWVCGKELQCLADYLLFDPSYENLELIGNIHDKEAAND